MGSVEGVGWGGATKRRRKGRGLINPHPAARKPRAGDGHGAAAWVGSAQRNRTWGPWGCTLVLKLEDVYHPPRAERCTERGRDGLWGPAPFHQSGTEVFPQEDRAMTVQNLQVPGRGTRPERLR